MIINKDMAKRLVTRMMEIIPYNINIFDEYGIIIASGDQAREGQVHQLARQAIENDIMSTVYQDESGMKAGVNVAIKYRDKVCGAVGISGSIDKTLPIINLVKHSIELLIEQEATQNNEFIKRHLKEQFIYEWLYKQDKYSDVFIARGKEYGIDITPGQKYTVSILHFKSAMEATQFLSTLASDSRRYYARSAERDIVIIHKAEAEDFSWLQELPTHHKGLLIANGPPDSFVQASFISAQATIEIGPLVFPEHIVFDFTSIEYFRSMMHCLKHDSFQSDSRKKLVSFWRNPEHSDLASTLLLYIQRNGKQTEVSDHLFIHRNTISYRLNKIHEKTGFDPYNYRDLFQLLCSYLDSIF